MHWTISRGKVNDRYPIGTHAVCAACNDRFIIDGSHSIMTLVDAVRSHQTRFLGTPAVTHARYPEGPFRILEYQDVPSRGAITVATLGLSDIPIHMFRQELLFLCYERFMSEDVLGLVGMVADFISKSNHPLFHGQVLPPEGPILEYSPMEALFVGTLMYFGTDEETYDVDVLEVGDLTVLSSWLIPIYASEADWIEKHGYTEFESMIVGQDPDLMDLTRPPMTLS